MNQKQKRLDFSKSSLSPGDLIKVKDEYFRASMTFFKIVYLIDNKNFADINPHQYYTMGNENKDNVYMYIKPIKASSLTFPHSFGGCFMTPESKIIFLSTDITHFEKLIL